MIFFRILVSILSGTMSSMGIGAGSIMLLYLTLFEHMDQRSAAAINLAFSLPVGILSIYFHNKNGLIVEKSMCRKTSMLGMIGCVIGSILSFIIPTYYLKKIFAIFLLYIGLKSLFN